MGVARFERIEGPFDKANVARESFVALEEFQHAADAAIAVGRENAGHVGVQVASVTADGGHGESEADHGVAIERADDVTTGLIGDDKGDVGLDLKIGFTPDGFLNGDAAVEVVAGHAGPAYGIPHEATIEAIRLAGRLEALPLDPVYSGKGLAGLIALIRQRRWRKDQDVVFLHTGGAPALFAYQGALGI